MGRVHGIGYRIILSLSNFPPPFLTLQDSRPTFCTLWSMCVVGGAGRGVGGLVGPKMINFITEYRAKICTSYFKIENVKISISTEFQFPNISNR